MAVTSQGSFGMGQQFVLRTSLLQVSPGKGSSRILEELLLCRVSLVCNANGPRGATGGMEWPPRCVVGHHPPSVQAICALRCHGVSWEGLTAVFLFKFVLDQRELPYPRAIPL